MPCEATRWHADVARTAARKAREEKIFIQSVLVVSARSKRRGAVQETFNRKIRRVRQAPLTALPNPLSDHLERNAKESHRVKTRIARLEFTIGLATDNAILDQGQIPALEILHFLPMDLV